MSTELRRHVEQLAVARLGAGADLPSWVSSATLMSITATAESTTVVCSAGAVPRKARPEGPFAAYEVVPDVGSSRAAALATALAGLPEEAEVRVVGTVDHDWVLVPTGSADLVAEQWGELGLDVVAAPAPTATEPERQQSERHRSDRKRPERKQL